jgi:hypothetical protein
VGERLLDRRSPVAVAAALSIVLVTIGCGITTEPALPSPTPSPSAIACTLPLTSDVYDGFHIGVPAGWDLFTLDGTVVVSRDSTGTEQTVVHPALVTAGQTPATMFTTLLDALQKQVAPAGVTMTATITSSGNQAPAAKLSLVSAQASVVGEAHLAILPEVTAHGSSQGAIIAYWAPPAQFATDKAMLAGIGACYGPEPGTLFQVMKDQVFTYAIPLGWTINGETQDAIIIADGNDASAAYIAYQFIPASNGVNSPDTLLSFALGKLGITLDQTLGKVKLPDQPAFGGATQSREFVEFTGSLTGRSLHGLANVLVVPGSAGASGVLRLALSTTALWNSVNSALVHIMGSIQHDWTQDIQSWENAERQWQAFGQQVQGFDYALTGVDLVHDPTTGATFEAPYSSWSATGQDGPGYYTRAGTKLQIETP